MFSRWIFLLGITLLPFQVVAEESYLSTLLDIEKGMLNGNDAVKEKLASIEGEYEKFTQEEKELYGLLKARNQYLYSELKASEETLKKLLESPVTPDTRAQANIILAGIEHLRGNSIEGFMAIDRAINMLGKVKNKNYRLSILNTAIGIYKESELLEYALEHARRLKVEVGESNDNMSLCVANYELGTIEVMVNSDKMAWQRLLLTKNYCKKANNKLMTIATDYYLAKVESGRGEFKKSIDRLLPSLEQANDIGWKLLIASINADLAGNYLELGENKAAKQRALLSYQLAKEAKDKRRLQKAASLLGQIYSNEGKRDEALKYYNEFRELSTENKVKIRQRKLAFDIARRGRI